MQRATTGNEVPTEISGIVGEALGSAGQPLEDSCRKFLEDGFGQDLRDVRVHTNAVAAESARALGSSAFTVGKNVVFGQNQYNPTTASGRKLIAHELGHVMQNKQAGTQTGRPLIQRKVEMRDVGKGEFSGFARLPELINRLNALSQGLIFSTNGAELRYEVKPGGTLNNFDRQMMAFIDQDAVIPL